jgi:hypothetical protein
MGSKMGSKRDDYPYPQKHSKIKGLEKESTAPNLVRVIDFGVPPVEEINCKPYQI